MQAIVINYFDEKVKRRENTEYFIDGKEVSFEEYRDIIESVDFGDEDIKYEDDESNGFIEACTEAINNTIELFDNSNACDDCKMNALMNLIMLGVDGALQGCIVRKE